MRPFNKVVFLWNNLLYHILLGNIPLCGILLFLQVPQLNELSLFDLNPRQPPQLAATKDVLTSVQPYIREDTNRLDDDIDLPESLQ